ncbi:MAG: polyphosphate:AMP phosphotransferase, partial [Chloroflexota bacterium]
MFESAELGHKLDKETFRREAPAARQGLLDAQFDLLERPEFPVIILIAGVDGAGKGETVNLLNEWMDPRHVHTFAMGAPTEDERERPPLWRFWQALPPKGRVGIFFGSWYSDPILRRAYGQSNNAEMDQAAQEIVRFEDMLTAEGALILKFWFHLSKKQQRQRLKALEADQRTRWRVSDQDWKNHKRYDDLIPVCERMLRLTSTGNAP